MGKSRWKEHMEHRIEKLERALARDPNHNPESHPTSVNLAESLINGTGDLVEAHGDATPSVHPTIDEPPMVTLNISFSLGAFPASSITKVTLCNQEVKSIYRQDMVSCGIISLKTAFEAFEFYKQNLDHLAHNLFTEIDSLADIRARSSILTAPVCTVAAFCTGWRNYQRCFEAFKDEVSRKLFSERYEFDDVPCVVCRSALAERYLFVLERPGCVPSYHTMDS